MPSINCGQPMEAQSLERVKYALDASGGSVEVLKRSDTVRISSGLAVSNITYKVDPTYPPEAKQARIQGMVVLLVKIDKEGRPHDIKLVSGVPELGQAAIDAVSQWRYKPYKLNGEPVEVETAVQINFTLNR